MVYICMYILLYCYYLMFYLGFFSSLVSLVKFCLCFIFSIFSFCLFFRLYPSCILVSVDIGKKALKQEHNA